MEAFLKGIYQEIGRIICSLWAYRLKIFVYIVIFILVAHFLNPYQSLIQNVAFVPESYRFYIPFLFAIFSAIALAELIIAIGNALYKRFYLWKHLTSEELKFIALYLLENTKTQYVVAYNGACRNSGMLQLLIKRRIIYLASTLSEYRGSSWQSAEQQFPFNMYDDAFKHFKKVLPAKNDAYSKTI